MSAGGGINLGSTITTSYIQNVNNVNSPTGVFFHNNWNSSDHVHTGFWQIRAGWTVVGEPTWVVTAVGDGTTDESITISGGTFLSGTAYSFTGSPGIIITGSGISISRS